MKKATVVFVAATVVGLAACDDGGASGPVARGSDYSARVVDACSRTMRSIDCGCFWEAAEPAFTAASVEPILQALAEREKWGPAITRARLEKVVGKDSYRTISQALYSCVQLR
jgi:hypothetical protein